MKSIIIASLLMGNGFSSHPSIGSGDWYKVEVTRTEQNLYKFTSGSTKGIIITKYCYEYATRDDALLKWTGSAYDGKLVFDNGTSCDVSEVHTFSN
jgi:hypothetical protein